MNILHVIEIRGVGGAEKLLLDFLPLQAKTAKVRIIISFE